MTDAKLPTKTNWFAELRSLTALGFLVLGFHSLVAKPFYIPSESMMPGLQVGDHLVVSKYPYGWSYVSPSFHVLPFMNGRLFGHAPERGDIVVLTPPDGDRSGEDLIKRVIGLPGDTVQMIVGRLWLNGKPVETSDLGARLIPVDGNFHCNPNDPDRARAFPGFAGAQVVGKDRKSYCHVHVIRETLPGGRSYETLDFGASSADNTPLYVVPKGRVFVMGDNRDNSADSRIPTEQNGLGGAIPLENIGGRAEFLTYSLSGNASWNPLTWASDFRPGRAGNSLRPSQS